MRPMAEAVAGAGCPVALSVAAPAGTSGGASVGVPVDVVRVAPGRDTDPGLAAFVAAPAFPCVGAKSALAKEQLLTFAAHDLGCPDQDAAIHAALLGFIADGRRARAPFRSFAVVFAGPTTLDEAGFEACLWQRLQALSDIDVARGFAYDHRVSADPRDANFAMSFGEEAFFIVGLHPAASRPARRFAHPTLVFNRHDQFEQMRATGTYDKMREVIIRRDVAYSGTSNPMLAAFGKVSEARQYSGRAVGGEWSCPFRRSAGATAER